MRTKLQHALGGLEGLAGWPLAFDERVFVEEWETRIFGLHAAMMGLSDSLRDAVPGYDLDMVPSTFRTTWTWADLRKGAESMNPFDYFRLRYYEKWLGGISAYLLENGYITRAELDATDRYREHPQEALPDRADDAVDQQVIGYLRQGDSPRRGPATPSFTVGDRVRVGNPPPAAHTRLPGYLRGRAGRSGRTGAVSLDLSVNDLHYGYYRADSAPVAVDVDGISAGELGRGGRLTATVRPEAGQVVRLSVGEYARRSRVKLSLLDLPLRPDQLLELIPPELRRNV